jgi:TonB-linked SusC/RagA family outer membrane protein
MMLRCSLSNAHTTTAAMEQSMACRSSVLIVYLLSKSRGLICMKPTAVLTMLLVLYAGQEVDAQLTFSVRNESLKGVFRIICQQLNYNVGVTNDFYDYNKKITHSFRNASLEQVLDTCLSGLPFTYEIDAGSSTFYIKTLPPQQGHAVSSINIKGTIYDEQKLGKAGVTIRVKGLHLSTTSNDHGRFYLGSVHKNAVLEITAVDIQPMEIPVGGKSDININTTTRTDGLPDVTITYNTGFQIIPKNKAIGSFSIANQDVIKYRAADNIMERLEGTAAGLLKTMNIVEGINQSTQSIRGRSTIQSLAEPLVVLGQFGYYGDYRNINPVDVEGITVLKDAVGTALWGTSSGNGVLVLTAFRPRYNQAPILAFTSAITTSSQPDVYYQPLIPAGELLQMQQDMFNRGAYNDWEQSPVYAPLSPWVEALILHRNTKLTSNQLDSVRNLYAGTDNRNEQQQHFYRRMLNQQYTLSLRGGSQHHAYYASIGYDNNRPEIRGSAYNRKTVTASHAYKPINNLELTQRFSYGENTRSNDNAIDRVPYNYIHLTEPDGRPAYMPSGLRSTYIDTAGGGRLLDWHYRPLDDFRQRNNTITSQDWLITLGVKYTPFRNLELSFNYQRQQSETKQINNSNQFTWFTRNLINRYTQINGNNISHPIPIGDIIDKKDSGLTADQLRWQFLYHHTQPNGNAFSLLGGFDLRKIRGEAGTTRLYGYSESRPSGADVDYATSFPQYGLFSKARIPSGNYASVYADHFLAWYLNGSYTYKERYVLAANMRKEEANIFGSVTNRRFMPLWSAGAGWQISEENFYNLAWLPFLKIQATYGSSGTINKKVSTHTTATMSGTNPNGSPTAILNNPPNPNLSWEKIRIFNIGMQFSIRNGLLEGSIEAWRKYCRDLIGNLPLDPGTGNLFMLANFNGMRGKGMDITLRSKVVHQKHFQYNTTFLFSYATDKVTDFVPEATAANNFTNPNKVIPVPGKPLFSVYSYRWKGLDNSNGDPIGEYQGTPSKNYALLFNATDMSSLEYSGPASPTVFGSLHHEFWWRSFRVAFLVTYRFKYSIRIPSVNYYNMFNNVSPGHSDYLLRWQKQGDENTTQVPSVPQQPDQYRDAFYSNASVNVEKGDHIRLQDVTIGYDFRNGLVNRLGMQHVLWYITGNNLCLLWKANKRGVDPNYIYGIPTPRTFTCGIKVEFKSFQK